MSISRRLNYQHLLYFWSVVRTGSLTRACSELSLSAPTISAQLRTLEERLGEKLLEKSGRKLVPTEIGRLVYQYADEIFGLGRELVEALQQRPTRRPLRFVVGIDDIVPKEIAQRLLEPALHLKQAVRFTCWEGTLERLLAQLQAHESDLVISDAPLTPALNLQVYSHPLGSCEVNWVATPALARKLRNGFPRSLNGAPMLLPTLDTAIRRALDQWLDRNDVRPVLLGEFEDNALLREFARAGHGVAPVVMAPGRQREREHGLVRIGPAHTVRAEYYAISVERRIKHPAIAAVIDHARQMFERAPA